MTVVNRFLEYINNEKDNPLQPLSQIQEDKIDKELSVIINKDKEIGISIYPANGNSCKLQIKILFDNGDKRINLCIGVEQIPIIVWEKLTGVNGIDKEDILNLLRSDIEAVYTYLKEELVAVEYNIKSYGFLNPFKVSYKSFIWPWQKKNIQKKIIRFNPWLD